MTHLVTLVMTKAMNPYKVPTIGQTCAVTSKMHTSLHVLNASETKSCTSIPTSPLHPLPVPDDHGDTVAIDFIGLLPEEHEKDTILTMMDPISM